MCPFLQHTALKYLQIELDYCNAQLKSGVIQIRLYTNWKMLVGVYAIQN